MQQNSFVLVKGEAGFESEWIRLATLYEFARHSSYKADDDFPAW
jgi:hypothetical protein